MTCSDAAPHVGPYTANRRDNRRRRVFKPFISSAQNKHH